MYSDSEVRVDSTIVNGTAVVGEDYKRRSETPVFSEDDRTRPLATGRAAGRTPDSTSIPPSAPGGTWGAKGPASLCFWSK